MRKRRRRRVRQMRRRRLRKRTGSERRPSNSGWLRSRRRRKPMRMRNVHWSSSEAAEAASAAAAAAQAQSQVAAAEAEKARLREQLRAQLNQVLETKEEAGRLIVNMSDVLFDFGQFTLKPGAKEKLAKISGILISHPGLTLEVDGHTDSVGSDAVNLTLSERRADTVRDVSCGAGRGTGYDLGAWVWQGQACGDE